MYSVNHIGLVVKDIEVSSNFYRQVLDCEFCDCVETEDATLLFLKAGDETLELIKYRRLDNCVRSAGIVDHIAFTVPDMTAALEKLAQFKVPLLLDKPKELPDKKIMFFSGPDGERLEFIQYLP